MVTSKPIRDVVGILRFHVLSIREYSLLLFTAHVKSVNEVDYSMGPIFSSPEKKTVEKKRTKHTNIQTHTTTTKNWAGGMMTKIEITHARGLTQSARQGGSGSSDNEHARVAPETGLNYYYCCVQSLGSFCLCFSTLLLTTDAGRT